MFTLLFNRDEVEAFWLYHDEADDLDNDEPGAEDHTFGGEACHKGTTPPDCPKPVHLFYNLALSDPCLGIRLANSKITRLPLYYALGNLGGPFRYRVVSDARIELLCQPYPKKYRAGILKEYLPPFPPALVYAFPNGYDPTKPEDVWNYGAVLGLGEMSARQKAALKKKLERWHLKNIGCPLVEKDDPDEPDPPLEEIVAGCDPFTQGMPEEKCPNPKCKQHKAGTPLPPLVLLKPEEDDPFYEIIAGGDSGQLIWQVCPNCASVVVTNPCT
jgi:hypothetical protein